MDHYIETSVFDDIEGVYCQGIHCGIKPEKLDLGYFIVPDAVAAAGVFTLNAFRASSVDYTQACLQKGALKGMIVNSGNANAGTGPEGDQVTIHMSEWVAEKLKWPAQCIGVASTGKIAEPLSLSPLRSGIDELFNDWKVSKSDNFADAICTTDLCSKQVSITRTIGGQAVTVAGVTKGSGMIAPNMATTLTFMATTVHCSQDQCQKWLSQAMDDSFNMLSVDTDTSTNDMAIMFATGAVRLDDQYHDDIQDLITEVSQELAKKIALDGEGATKLITVVVSGASTKQDARGIAKQVLDSPLVKTAIHGEDPNWGRIVAAVGKNPDHRVDMSRLCVTLQDIALFHNGQPTDIGRDELAPFLKEKSIKIHVQLGLGTEDAVGWGCDLSEGYIKINTQYT